jgi:beta-glucosidase/6-phospho-beta-glucosidase/beta-galactosidase
MIKPDPATTRAPNAPATAPLRHSGPAKAGIYFATGIENSNPTIDNGRIRIDEMQSCGHYEQWSTDFDKVQELGISFLRYGPPLYKTFLGPSRFDWSFADTAFADLRRRKIIPIVDLCHFGVPDWIGNFQNPDFPELFERYAAAFAQRFPWVQLYTPINEMYICALFSARYGWWNEQLHDERSFVTALKHICKANLLAMKAILARRPDAIFIQSESTEYFHPISPDAIRAARLRNSERFVTLDLTYAHPVDSETYQFLMDNGMTREEYAFFLDQKLRYACIMGNDYYATNEHRVDPDGVASPAGEIFGYGEITTQYFERYRLPVMHTETNFAQGPRGDEAVHWLWKQWANLLQARFHRVVIVGFTWYSLTDQIDWDTALRERNHRVCPVGLYDLNRQIRPVGQAYKQLIEEWGRHLSTETVCLTVPIEFPE